MEKPKEDMSESTENIEHARTRKPLKGVIKVIGKLIGAFAMLLGLYLGLKQVFDKTYEIHFKNDSDDRTSRVVFNKNGDLVRGDELSIGDSVNGTHYTADQSSNYSPETGEMVIFWNRNPPIGNKCWDYLTSVYSVAEELVIRKSIEHRDSSCPEMNEPEVNFTRVK